MATAKITFEQFFETVCTDNKQFVEDLYNCFEFLMTDVSKPFIKTFVENELRDERRHNAWRTYDTLL